MQTQSQVTSTSPSLLGTGPTIGFGDRLGLATPGHAAALREAGGSIGGIFAQQSIREMTRTDRTAKQVMRDAQQALDALSYDAPWGADADHLKNQADVDCTVEAGFTFFTIDPSEEVDDRVESYDGQALAERFAAIRRAAPWIDAYQGRRVPMGNFTIEFDEQTLRRAAVKYAPAIERAIALARYIEQQTSQRGQPCELEVSIDETETPTTPAEHYLIAEQLRQAGINLVSLAPRFVGELEKGVDYKGDLAELERTMHQHAAIAEQLGPYKLSLHSGSDKLSMYRLLSEATGGRFHVKTAGTSYLEALRVLARHRPKRFREVIDYARTRYDEDKATYHVSATNDSVPAPASIADDQTLERLYLGCWQDVAPGRGLTEPGRQILHCTFGSVVTHPELGPMLREALHEHAETYRDVLREHFVYHLRALNGS